MPFVGSERHEKVSGGHQQLLDGTPTETMSELYSRMEFELDRRLDEAERVGVGFTVPSVEVAPSAPRISEEVELELALQEQ